MSAAVSVFKLSVQSVCQLHKCRIEVYFEMTRLPYQWTPVANHSISIARQSSAQQCWLVWRIMLPVSHLNPMNWDLAT